MRGQLASALGSTTILEKQLSSTKADTEVLKQSHAEQVQGLEKEAADSHRTLAALQAQNEELHESHTQLEGHFQASSSQTGQTLTRHYVHKGRSTCA